MVVRRGAGRPAWIRRAPLDAAEEARPGAIARGLALRSLVLDVTCVRPSSGDKARMLTLAAYDVNTTTPAGRNRLRRVARGFLDDG